MVSFDYAEKKSNENISNKIMTIILFGLQTFDNITVYLAGFKFIITFFSVCGSINGHAG